MSEGEGGGLENKPHEQFETGLGIGGLADSAFGVLEGVAGMIPHTEEHIIEHLGTPNLMPGAGAALGPLGMFTGGFEMAGGVGELEEGNLNGAVGVAKGGAGLIGGGATTLGALSASAGGESILGVAAGGGSALTSAGAGGIGGMFTTAGGALAAAPIAGVAGAAGAGLAAGTAMASFSDSRFTRTGTWGQNSDGQNASAMDAAANWGAGYDDRNGDAFGDWTLGGAARSIGGGIAAAEVAPYVAAADLAGRGLDAVGLGGATHAAKDFLIDSPLAAGRDLFSHFAD